MQTSTARPDHLVTEMTAERLLGQEHVPRGDADEGPIHVPGRSVRDFVMLLRMARDLKLRSGLFLDFST